MKFTKIALSFAAIIGVTALGGSWYTGKQVEERYHELLESGNQALKQLQIYGVDAQINEVKLTRGWFSSAVSYNLDAEFDGESYQFKGDDKIFHGPFPLNRLSAGNFLPSMASAESHITVPENLQAVFAGKEFLTAQTDINYSGEMQGKAKIAPSKSTDSAWQISETALKFALNRKGVGEAEFAIGQIIASEPSENIQISLEGMRYQLKLSENFADYPFLAAGKYEWQLDKLSIAELMPTDAALRIDFNKVVSTGEGKINQNRYEGSSDAVLDVHVQTQFGQAKLGKVKLDIFTDFAAEPLNKMISISGDFEKANSPEFEQYLQQILTDAPKFHIKSFSFENEQGKNELALILNLDRVEPQNLSGFDDILALFQQSKLSISLNIPSLEILNQQRKLFSADGTENAKQQAKEEVSFLVQQAKQSGLAVVEGDTIKFDLQIDNGKITLNGNDVPPAQAQGIIFMLMLGLGGY